LLVFAIPKAMVRFGGFQYAKENMFTGKDKLSNFMCGIFAGFSESTLVVTPQETIKTKLVHDRL
jgi:solute carrier family 25 citrate transporter 1